MTNTYQGTGEEWKAMDVVTSIYKPDETIISAAKANIEKLRKRDVELRLVDRAGKPLANATVDIVQHRNAFAFGDQLWGMDRLHREGQWDHDRARYARKRFAELLNAANALCYWTERPRNDGPKSEDLQGEPRYEHFAAMVDWANSEGLYVKGHPLFWSIQKCVPDWVKRYDYETQMKFAEVRVRNLVARFKGKMRYWDAVNEPMWEPAFRNLPQRNWPHIDPISEIADYIEPVLRWCRDEDPDACFVINDYGMEANKGDENKGQPAGAPDSEKGKIVTAAFQRKRFLSLIKELYDRGAPPSALGLQSHTGGWLTHDMQLAVYDEFATANVPVHVTEFWAHTKHLRDKGVPEDVAYEAQAEYVSNYVTVAFGHPAIEAFFFWGVSGDAIKWFGDSSSHELTPVFHRLRKLIKEEWLTRQTLKTDADGKLKFRGFFGDYTLRYAISGKNSAHQQGLAFKVEKGASGVQTLTAPHLLAAR